MAPLESDDASEDVPSSNPGSESDAGSLVEALRHSSADSDAADARDLEEEEYHTEDSDASDEEVGQGPSVGARNPTTPLLPPELLKAAPTTTPSAVTKPWAQLSRKEKQSQRRKNQTAKKELYDRLRQETKGTGVLQAGRFAQVKRGLVAVRERVRSGRVEKATKTQTSGRQRLLEERKRLAEDSASQLMRPAKKAKTKSKR